MNEEELKCGREYHIDFWKMQLTAFLIVNGLVILGVGVTSFVEWENFYSILFSSPINWPWEARLMYVIGHFFNFFMLGPYLLGRANGRWKEPELDSDDDLIDNLKRIEQ